MQKLKPHNLAQAAFGKIHCCALLMLLTVAFTHTIVAAAPAPGVVGAKLSAAAVGLSLAWDEAAEKESAGRIVGPETRENNCQSCHALEYSAWENTHHFATFKVRHRSDRAKEIMGKLGQKSMKRSTDCRGCHYTSILRKGKVKASWGVSCESCHGPAKDYVNVHNKAGGDPGAATVKWGDKSESADARNTRLTAAAEKGMLHPKKLYDIARNCFGCHTVPNEMLVNKGGHKSGSDFDLVAWSQGEIRHNFASSPGAPDSPSNRPASPEQLRRLYVVGAMVDLEVTLENLTKVAEKGGKFHKAMVARANMARKKVAAFADQIPEIAAALGKVPASIDESTSIPADLLASLKGASTEFVANNDGSGLGAIDSNIPTQYKGTAYEH